jgi:hypothetical protein
MADSIKDNKPQAEEEKARTEQINKHLVSLEEGDEFEDFPVEGNGITILYDGVD